MAEEKTDLERFLALYESFGIELEAREQEDGSYLVYLNWYRLSEGEPPGFDKFKGWAGFHSKVVFDADGNFVEQGFWE